MENLFLALPQRNEVTKLNGHRYFLLTDVNKICQNVAHYSYIYFWLVKWYLLIQGIAFIMFNYWVIVHAYGYNVGHRYNIVLPSTHASERISCGKCERCCLPVILLFGACKQIIMGFSESTLFSYGTSHAYISAI